MTGAELRASAYVRWACLAAIVFLFALPCIVGRLTTYFVLLFGLLAMVTPTILASFSTRSRNPIDLMFVAAAALPSLAFLFTWKEPHDLLFAFNFAPLLLAIPFRWQLERHARTDGAALVGWLSLAGAAIALAVAFIQVVVLDLPRAGQPLMNPFQFADTAMLLGFLAPVGLFAAGANRRSLLLLAGPVLGTAATVLSGTRGALVAAPVLALVLFGFAIVRSNNRKQVVAIASTVAVAGIVTMLVASLFGFTRALEGFLTSARVLNGGAVDGPTLERLTMYQGAWQAFIRAPLTGYGWNDMVPAIYPYVPADMLEKVKTFRQLHNGFFSFAVGAGLPGVVSFLILSVAPLVAVFWTPRDEQFDAQLYFALVLCSSYAVFQLTYITIGYEFQTVQFAFMTMVLLGFMRAPVLAARPPHSARGNASVGSETVKTA